MNDQRSAAEKAEWDHPEEHLPSPSACPGCGERRYDWLIWDVDGVYVTCAVCGARWWPNTGCQWLG